MKRFIIMTCYVLAMGLATNVSAQLLVHYLLDEATGIIVADTSGNGFHGTITGTEKWVAGTIDGALEFSGGETVTLPAADIGLTPDMGSVAFWMNADVPTSNINTMFWAGDNTTGSGFGPENEMHVHLEQTVTNVWLGGEFVFFATTTASDQFVFLHSDPEKGGAAERANTPVNPILLGDKEWHHVAATWGEGFAMTYIDGKLVMDTAYESGGYELTNIVLGKMASGDRTYTGKLDDFRIYGEVLSDEDINYLFLKQEPPSYIADFSAKQQEFVLNESYPNPFAQTTTISYQLATNTDVLLSVYNLTGQIVRTLVRENQGSGSYSVVWDGSNDAGHQLNSGIYLYRLQTKNLTQTRKLMLIK